MQNGYCPPHLFENRKLKDENAPKNFPQGMEQEFFEKSAGTLRKLISRLDLGFEKSQNKRYFQKKEKLFVDSNERAQFFVKMCRLKFTNTN